MTVRPVLAALMFASLVLGATAASACPWADAQASSDQSQVASGAPGQGDQAPVAKPN